MSFLSIVVPVYRVQAYVSECLDSLLEQSFSDIEIIAVDDCSPDRSGELLDDYARRDSRVRVLHLPENRGLGPARNAGLAAATGRYVWFLDSDDWVAPDCLRKIAERLRVTRPDVLVVDYARAYWNLKAVRNTAGHLLAGAPEVFRASEYPDLLRLFPGVWTKIVRRDFLRATGIGFPAGYYEDLPFTYPLLCAASRIAVLDEVCVYYRQRRHGSILTSHGRDHLVLLDQYREVFRRLRRAGTPLELRTVVFDRMVDHLLLMLSRRGRLGAGTTARPVRRTFFREAADLCRIHRPAGWRQPPGINAVRYRLLEAGSWPLFCALRIVYQVLRVGRDTARRVARPLRRRVRRARSAARTAMLRGYYQFQRRLPIDGNLAVYSIYWGAGYGCHAAAIYERALTVAPHVRGVWIVTPEARENVPAGVAAATIGSAAYYRALARAKYVFNNVNFPDFMVKRPGSVHVQTHHGTPLKAMGIDLQRCPTLARGNNFANLLKRCDRWDYSLSYSPYCSQVWEHAYPARFTELEYGAPRNDALVAPDPGRIAEIRAGLGIGPDETVVLYAPTFREYRRSGTPLVDYERLRDAIGPNARLLVREHHFDRSPARDDLPAGILDVSHHPRVADLYLAADALVTDYSSGMFDYAVLDRPIVVYAPDWEVYRTIRGAYFDLMAQPPGVVARTADELLAAFRTGAYADAGATTVRAAFRERFCGLDDGHAAERVVRHVMLGQPQAARDTSRGEHATAAAPA